MLEVGNGKNGFEANTSELTASQARSHFSMWAIMKAVMLLGTDLVRPASSNLYLLV
jgi:hypothetical protein